MNASPLLWSNAVISLSAAGCVLATLELAGVQGVSAEIGLFCGGISAATWCAYSWQRQVKSTRDRGLRPDHRAWRNRHVNRLRRMAWLAIPLACAPLYLTLQAAGSAQAPFAQPWWIGIAAAMLITALYAGFPGQHGTRQALRRIPGLKMIWIGWTWAAITALWPLWWVSMDHGLDPTPDWMPLAAERFLVIAALTLPFDLRDRHWDAAVMHTWPQRIGPTGTRALALTFLLGAILIRLQMQPENAGVALGLLPMVMAVLLAREDRSPAYFVGLDALLLADAAWLCFGG